MKRREPSTAGTTAVLFHLFFPPLCGYTSSTVSKKNNNKDNDNNNLHCASVSFSIMHTAGSVCQVTI